MTQTRLRVKFAGPYTSLQDVGRFGMMRFGVPASGPMDRHAFAVAQTMLGLSNSTAIEVALGGLVIECIEGAVTLAVAGGDFNVQKPDQKLDNWTVTTLDVGQTLTIRPGDAGSWCYVQVAGKIDAPKWLGSHATHALSELPDGMIETGDIIKVNDALVLQDREGAIPRPDMDKDVVRVVMGPQDHHFDDTARNVFLTESFHLTNAFDRMGVRLDGPSLPMLDALSIPSEPVLRGAVQVAGDGVATVLLADHGTTGGYPKIATVIACDLDRLVQKRAGDTIRFTMISPQDAIAITRDAKTRQDTYLANIYNNRGTLTERLLRENLIGGVVRA